MKRLATLLGEDEGFFGPGTDLAISLAAVLLLMIAVKSSLDAREDRAGLEIKDVLDNQTQLVEALADRYGIHYQTVRQNTYAITFSGRVGEDSPDILIQNDATLQRISFGSHVLFKRDEIELSTRGIGVLEELSTVLLEGRRLERIQEIQIQGHADPTPSQRFSSNLELAAHRAMTVFRTLQTFGIDPRFTMMSATTFGEYVSVQRRSKGSSYSPEQLEEDNDSPMKMTMNRRIEILLFYRRLSVGTAE